MKIPATRKIRYLTLLLIGLFLVTFFLQPVEARLAVAPLTLKLDIPPGKVSSKDLTIHNTGQDPVSVGIRLVDWWRTPEGNLQLMAPGTRERSCAEWTLYSTEELTLGAGERRNLSVQIEVPNDVTGDHWAMLLVTEKPKPVEGEEQVTTRVTVNYAVKILQQDPYTDQRDGKITNIKLTGKNPLSLAVTYKNTGPTHLQSTGTVDIRNIEGETVREFEINEFPTLPGEERIVEVSGPDDSEALTPGTYYAIVVMDFGGDRLIQGGLPFEIKEEGERSGSSS